MEERTLEDNDERLIKIKRSKEGMVEDVVDSLTGEMGEVEEETEVLLDFPEQDEEEIDEGLVGLTPEMLEKELARREEAAKKAQEKHDELLAEGNRLLAEGDFEGSEPFFAQALLYNPVSFEASSGVWTARTKDYTDLEPLFDEDNAYEISEAEPNVKELLREKVGGRLSSMRYEMEREAEPLRVSVKAGQDSRRDAFKQNRNYYLWRTLILFSVFIVMAVGAVISATFLVRTTSILPIVFLCVGGGLAFAFIIVSLIFMRKLLVADRLCRDNEKLSSTKEGARLAELEDRLACIACVLDDEADE